MGLSASTWEVEETLEVVCRDGLGCMHHHRILFDNFHKLRNKFYCPIINIDKRRRQGVLPENQPILVKAKLVSKTTEEKIKEAGGAVVLTA
ncbi:putative 60S ribosomal protein L27a-1 [Hibiscus syriacus]|uniref:60S ribosomal protein L27a-1 n=1 Tax=Hibiscus syriacus TaxID=106335 RepID=A0A6A3C6E9_HIBSY|nr:putative 60S ribosomal protein L27a-1 [Hibiscus syriacus]